MTHYFIAEDKSEAAFTTSTAGLEYQPTSGSKWTEVSAPEYYNHLHDQHEHRDDLVEEAFKLWNQAVEEIEVIIKQSNMTPGDREKIVMMLRTGSIE